MDPHSLFDKLRLGPWLLATLILCLVIGLLYPQQLGVLLWSLTKLTAGGYLGYWLDRNLFPYARPHRFFDQASRHGSTDHHETAGELRWVAGVSTLRRAIVIAACILALGLGV